MPLNALFSPTTAFLLKSRVIIRGMVFEGLEWAYFGFKWIEKEKEDYLSPYFFLTSTYFWQFSRRRLTIAIS
jgi:hypothetical protein